MPIEFGRYTLHEKVGAGGMAEVYRATISGAGGFEKQFAIKRILDHHAEDSEFIKMFMDEARIVAALSHPNIAQVFEFDELDGVYFLAMEYVQGRNLAQVLRAAKDRNRPFEHDLAIHVAMETCKGLYAAHIARDSRGRRMKIIHRDISPQNVQISFAGDVKILDFGVAKARDRIIQTEAGTIRGKLLYMAPEQVRAKPIDHRADIFSMGLVLYKSLTGVHPFEAESEVKVVDKIRRAQIDPPSDIVVGLPQGLDEVVMKSLAIKRDERYSDAAEFHRDLAEILHETSPGFSFSSLASYMEGLFAHELDHSGSHSKLGLLDSSSRVSSALSDSSLQVDSEELAHLQGTAPGTDTDGMGLGAPTIEVAGPPAPPGFATAAGSAPPPPPPMTTITLTPDRSGRQAPTSDPSSHSREVRLAGIGRGKVIFGVSVVLGTVFGIIAAVALTPGSKGDGEKFKSAFGALSVATAPAGAEIHLDGKLLRNETGRPLVTPAEVQRLTPGPHRLELFIPGYRRWKGEVHVKGGARLPISEHLSLTPGRLRVTSTPTGASVILDGAMRGKTPLVVEGIDRGREHRLRLEAPGRKPLEQKLSLEEEAVDLQLRLEPVARAAPRTTAVAPKSPRRTFRAVDSPDPPSKVRYGWLSLNSIPSARIFVDGRDTRKSTPAAKLRMSTGRHTVSLQNKELSLSRSFDVVIRAGEIHTRRVDFRGKR